eukprot:13143814-Alexandrium_andersonii.AAC.1
MCIRDSDWSVRLSEQPLLEFPELQTSGDRRSPVLRTSMKGCSTKAPGGSAMTGAKRQPA